MTFVHQSYLTYVPVILPVAVTIWNMDGLWMVVIIEAIKVLVVV